MKIWLIRFNIYLLAVTMAVLAGCKSPDASDEAAQKNKETKEEKNLRKKELSTIRLYLEVNPDETSRTMVVELPRHNPMQIGIWRDPFLDESLLEEARVIEVPGGCTIRLQFTIPDGARRLEMATGAHKDQRIVILSAFPEVRWIAAPKITKRIVDGAIEFTPDASREEAERIVKGLNKVAETVTKNKKKTKK